MMFYTVYHIHVCSFIIYYLMNLCSGIWCFSCTFTYNYFYCNHGAYIHVVVVHVHHIVHVCVLYIFIYRLLARAFYLLHAFVAPDISVLIFKYHCLNYRMSALIGYYAGMYLSCNLKPNYFYACLTKRLYVVGYV